MMVYNETVIVDEAIYPQWLSWMQDEYIPTVMATACFHSYSILRVVDSPNEGITCCIQYFTDSAEAYELFAAKYQQKFHAIHYQQFENQFVLFNTLMQTIN